METKKKTLAVDNVVDALINDIIGGKWNPGDKLPTEPELSERYGVGRNTVREAIKQLQAFGILYIRRADGTYIADSYQDRMLTPMLYSLILQKHDWKDFVQLRAVIDIGTLNVALENPAVCELVPQLNEIIDALAAEMASETPSVDRILELDLNFHCAIAKAIQSPQVDTVTSYIARPTVPSRREAVRRWLESGETARFVNLHRQIVDVIARRDTSQIVRVVEEHYVNWK